MFDTIKFVIQEKDINYEMCFLEEIPCRISIEKCTGNRVIGRIKNIRIEVRGATLIVEGSLLKYYQGNNYADYLTRWRTKAMVDTLSEILGVPLEKAKITRIDIGFCYNMKNPVWLYLTRLTFEGGYFRSHINKETLYFNKYDSMLCFYDKIKEMEKHKELKEVEELKELNVTNVLRYEFRLKKVSKTFRKTIKGTDLYDIEFCQAVLDIWYNRYMNLQKTFETELSAINFYSKKDFKLFCVAFTMSRLNLFCALEEAFAKGEITSKKKYDIKEVLKDAESFITDTANCQNLIDELTIKIENTYNRVKKDINRPFRPWMFSKKGEKCKFSF